jgi:hypothetical protein
MLDEQTTEPLESTTPGALVYSDAIPPLWRGGDFFVRSRIDSRKKRGGA